MTYTKLFDQVLTHMIENDCPITTIEDFIVDILKMNHCGMSPLEIALEIKADLESEAEVAAPVFVVGHPFDGHHFAI